MSCKFFVIVHDPSWRMSAEDFHARLKARWPDAKTTIVQSTESNHAIDIEIPRSSYVQTAYFTRDGQAVVIDYTGSVDCAEVAIWFRSIVPPQCEVVFLEESGDYYTELKPGVTEEDMLALMKPTLAQ